MATSDDPFDLFKVPDFEFEFDSKRDDRYFPAATGINPITFSIPPQDNFVDLSETRVFIKLKLDHAIAGYEGIEMDRAISTGTSTKNVRLVNNFAHSLFSQIRLKLNGALMTLDSHDYHHKAYIETLLNFSLQEGETVLAPQGWVNGALDCTSVLACAGNNTDAPTAEEQAAFKGYEALKPLTERLAETHYCTFVMTPNLAPFQTKKPRVTGVQIDLQFYLNPPELWLYGLPQKGTMAAGLKKLPRIRAEDIDVQVQLRRMNLNPDVFMKYKEAREEKLKVAKYPVVRSKIRTFSIPAGMTRWQQDNVFLGRLPDRVLIAVLRSDAFNGVLDRYPFAYERNQVVSVKQIVNSEEYPNKTTVKQSTVAEQLDANDLEGYARLMTAMSMKKDSGLPMLRPSDWGEGKSCTIYLFNNVPGDNPNRPDVRNPPQAGNTRFEIEFSAATTTNYTVLIWREEENVFEVNHRGGVKYLLDS